MVVMVTQHCENAKNLIHLHFKVVKMVNRRFGEFYLT
jgi:hypothetical protein